jgi:hypothetical protein
MEKPKKIWEMTKQEQKDFIANAKIDHQNALARHALKTELVSNATDYVNETIYTVHDTIVNSDILNNGVITSINRQDTYIPCNTRVGEAAKEVIVALEKLREQLKYANV